MVDDRWSKLEQIFSQAVLLPPQKRKSFVEENCPEDDDLCAELCALIDADLNTAEIFGEPIFPLVARVLEADYLQLLKKGDFGSYKLLTHLTRYLKKV